MSTALFPLAFANDEARLLTAVALGFLFGFALERGGFGNARKLAAQFYLHDMTVFKVMFTAILVAMVGLYTLAGFGLVDMARVWVNPTFVWAQAVGGFLLGVGFIMSGLCPGTAVVSAASGRWDGAVTLVGIFFGTLGFTVAVDAFPALEALYHAGDLGVSILPAVLGLPTLPFVLGIVVVAGLGFLGAEAVERVFSGRRPAVELSPRPLRLAKYGLAAGLLVVVGVAVGFRPAPFCPPRVRLLELEPVTPAELAERIIAGDPDLMVLDLRQDPEDRIPGSYPAALDSTALALLSAAGSSTEVVLVDDDGSVDGVPGVWPAARLRALRGGWTAWEREVLTPMEPTGASAPELERVRRHNAVAAFFSGAAVQAPVAAPPPAIPSGGGGAKPKRGGC